MDKERIEAAAQRRAELLRYHPSWWAKPMTAAKAALHLKRLLGQEGWDRMSAHEQREAAHIYADAHNEAGSEFYKFYQNQQAEAAKLDEAFKGWVTLADWANTHGLDQVTLLQMRNAGMIPGARVWLGGVTIFTEEAGEAVLQAYHHRQKRVSETLKARQAGSPPDGEETAFSPKEMEEASAEFEAEAADEQLPKRGRKKKQGRPSATDGHPENLVAAY